MREVKSRRGFTLVELSLSIAFIAILSITVTLIINQSISTYRRGLTLNQVNTVGMDLVDDIRSVIQNSPAKAVKDACSTVFSDDADRNIRGICEANNGLSLVLVKKKGNVVGVGSDVPIFGAFCSGSYSYIWKSGYFYQTGKISDNLNVSLSYKNIGEGDNGPSHGESNFKLLKVKDESRSVCISGNKNGQSGTFNLSSPISNDDIEILLRSDDTLALYDFAVAPPATNDLNTASFYSVSFILGTVEGGININSAGNFCKTPESDELDEDFDYCAINKFNFAAQAIGG